MKYDSLTGKSVIDSTISHFDPHINKILGINNENYIDTLLLKKIFSFKINKLSTTDNIFNSKPSDILYMGYLNEEISFGDIIYFEPKNIQYKTYVNCQLFCMSFNFNYIYILPRCQLTTSN